MATIETSHIDWRRVSAKYVMRELIGIIITTLIFAAVAVVLGLALPRTWWWLIPAGFALIAAIQIIFAWMRARAIGYALRQDDLVFKRGLLYQRLVAVPYGRLQMVDIHRDPIDRMLGLASLKTMTASPTTDVTIPGLPTAEVEQLRDHLIRVAETRRAGL